MEHRHGAVLVCFFRCDNGRHRLCLNAVTYNDNAVFRAALERRKIFVINYWVYRQFCAEEDSGIPGEEEGG